MRIGFIGLGNMGGPMSRNLIKAGHKLVVNDLNPAAATPHREMGADWADTPAAVASATEVVFTSLPGPKEVEAVALGAEGIIEGLPKGAILIDASTGCPGLFVRLLRRSRRPEGICLMRPSVVVRSGLRQARLLSWSAGTNVFLRKLDRCWRLSVRA